MITGIFIISFVLPQAFGAYVEFENGKDRIAISNDHVVDFKLDWGTGDFPAGKIKFDESVNDTILLQIPKSIPRTTNLDFGHFSLYALQTDGSEFQIKETESECFYILEIPVKDSDFVEIVGASVATGRWEPVTIQNEECNERYSELTSKNGSMLPSHAYPVWKELPPLKQYTLGVATNEIHCNDNLILIHKKYDGTPACVKPETHVKLIERGWTKDQSKKDRLILKYNPVLIKGTGVDAKEDLLSSDDLQQLEKRKLELDALLEDNPNLSEIQRNEFYDERKLIGLHAERAFDEKVSWDLVKILWEKSNLFSESFGSYDREKFPIPSFSGVTFGFDAYSLDEQYVGKTAAIKVGILKEEFTRETLERTDKMVREIVGDEIDIVYYKSHYIVAGSES